MGNSSNKCFRCRYFRRFYTKGNNQFDKSNCGWCCLKKDYTKSNDGCEQYVLKHTYKKSRKSVFNCLDNLLMELSAIRMVIEDDKRELEENKELL